MRPPGSRVRAKVRRWFDLTERLSMLSRAGASTRVPSHRRGGLTPVARRDDPDDARSFGLVACPSRSSREVRRFFGRLSFRSTVVMERALRCGAIADRCSNPRPQSWLRQLLDADPAGLRQLVTTVSRSRLAASAATADDRPAQHRPKKPTLHSSNCSGMPPSNSGPDRESATVLHPASGPRLSGGDIFLDLLSRNT